MTLQERSMLLQSLYREQAELSALFQSCQSLGALTVGVPVACALQSVNEALAEFRPESSAPDAIRFPRSKF